MFCVQESECGRKVGQTREPLEGKEPGMFGLTLQNWGQDSVGTDICW